MSVLMAVLGLMLAGQGRAQTFTTLHSFTNNDGAYPYAGLILSDDKLYGTTFDGGISGNGTVFAVNTDGTGFTNLHCFTAIPSSPGPFTNSDGANPYAGLIFSKDTLYGTAYAGGSSGGGTVFAVHTDGKGFTTLHSFTADTDLTNADGANPYGGLILSGDTLYGTAFNGGNWGHGTVFEVHTDGTGFAALHSFTAAPWPTYTNADGANPYGGLILSGETLYGTTCYGGSSGYGTVFAMNTNGRGFTILHSFTAIPYPQYPTNTDGAFPRAATLVLSSNTLYGTAPYGGSSGYGTVFAINTNGTGFAALHSFTTLSSTSPNINSDGVGPPAGLVLLGTTLYGTAAGGGSEGAGTVFGIHTDGTGFTAYSFGAGGIEGAYPLAGLILSGDTLYGTTSQGGSSRHGTVFSLSFRPQLASVPFGTNAVLTWPTNNFGFDYSGFTLQSTTDLVSPVWTTNSPAPVVINGQNTVTNPISGTQQFFRLSQ